MSREWWFLLGGLAAGAGLMRVLDRRREDPVPEGGCLEPAVSRTPPPWSRGIEFSDAGFEAMDDDDLETPYSGYSGT